MFSSQASRKAKKKEGGALRAQRASSNVFSNFEQTQIQEFKEVRPCSCTGNPSTQKLIPEGSPGKCNAGDKTLDPEPGKGVQPGEPGLGFRRSHSWTRTETASLTRRT